MCPTFLQIKQILGKTLEDLDDKGSAVKYTNNRRVVVLVHYAQGVALGILPF